MTDRRRVLVADDDQDIVELVAWALQDAGFDTIEASDGLEALRLTVQENPDLLVLDIGMPALEGDAVLRILQAKGGSAPPVIFLTARAAPADRAEGLMMGAADYMVKPFDVVELIARVEKAIRDVG